MSSRENGGYGASIGKICAVQCIAQGGMHTVQHQFKLRHFRASQNYVTFGGGPQNYVTYGVRPHPNFFLLYIGVHSNQSFIHDTRNHRVSCIVYRVSCIVYRVSCIVYRVSCIVYRVSCIVYRVSIFVYLDTENT